MTAQSEVPRQQAHRVILLLHRDLYPVAAPGDFTDPVAVHVEHVLQPERPVAGRQDQFEFVPDGKLAERTEELAMQCARCAPESLQLTKRMLNETIGEPLITQLAAGAAVSATARTTQAAAEGLAAFNEKREPQWE